MRALTEILESERELSGVIIRELAALARLGMPDHFKTRWPNELVEREPVMQSVVRIRAAIDKHAKTVRALASTGSPAKARECDTCGGRGGHIYPCKEENWPCGSCAHGMLDHPHQNECSVNGCGCDNFSCPDFSTPSPISPRADAGEAKTWDGYTRKTKCCGHTLPEHSDLGCNAKGCACSVGEPFIEFVGDPCPCAPATKGES